MDQSPEFPLWDADDPSKSLENLHQWTVKKAQERIDWYDDKRKPKKFYSQWIRGLVILFSAIGGLCPLIDATGILASSQTEVSKVALGQWGYVFIALAVAVFSFDKYYGLSSGWMRFMLTQLSLQKALLEFQYDWAILSAQQAGQPSDDKITSMLQKLKDFSLQVENLVKQETDDWVVEFQSNIAALGKVLQAEVETRKPGNIKVTVTNASEFESVEVFLNDRKVKKFVKVSEGLIDAVPPGRYEITAIGKKDNQDFKESKVAEVQPNSMASVEITLRSS